MPVTKTAKRALRGSQKKKKVNDIIRVNLEIALRTAKKSKKAEAVKKAISCADKAVKAKIIHKNKASHIKSSLSKLLRKPVKTVVKKASAKKAPKKSSSK